MKGFKNLTLKRILKKHQDNPADKEAHKTIETKKIQKNTFNILIQKSTTQKPFDKKK